MSSDQGMTVEQAWEALGWAVAVLEVDAQDYTAGKLREAAATLRAEIERLEKDAGRYRWLCKGNNDDIAVVRGLGAMDYGMSAVACTYSEEIDGDDLDAAIDEAMKKKVSND